MEILIKRLVSINEAISMSAQGARSSLTSAQEQERRSGSELVTGYHYLGH